jgi:mRNA interferase RelE/StbE
MKIIFLSSFLKDLKKMKGHSIAYRIKSGNYRMGFYKELDQVELARFLKREDIYKVFPQ